MFFLAASFICHQVKAADIALIIDDIGYKSEDINAFTLPSEVTFSILPHTPYSISFSQLAEQQQREVMMHVPMEALSGKSLGPGALTANMYPQDIKSSLAAAHESVPNAIAINNHMGSKLTQLTLPMTATMEYLHDTGLYFVDSRTTKYSRAENIANKMGVPSLHRHVFLDHIPEPRHIAMQFKRLRRIANKYGQAVGIAHPHPQTLSYLKQHLPELAEEGVRLVPLSELILGKHGQLAMNRYRENARFSKLPESQE
ncbi:divergent polysaccharide deacetylase family protein [Alteromonas sp. a30]|nr:divergent polysaccharide deacetylase family protein [Alteromonas sp. a30]